jgi:hypothetical protein
MFEEFYQALLSAFPTPRSLEQMLSFKMGYNLHAIAGGNNYGETIFSLIQWAEARAKTLELIKAARADNPGNVALSTFERTYNMRYVSLHATEPSTNPPIPLLLSTALVDTLLKLPGVDEFRVRSSLLSGLPSVHSLERSSTNARRDLEGVIDQLHHLGRTSPQRWPLVMLVDTAIMSIQGYTLEEEFRQLRQTLLHYYEGI